MKLNCDNTLLQPVHCWTQWRMQLSDLPSFLYASQKSTKTVQTAEQVGKNNSAYTINVKQPPVTSIFQWGARLTEAHSSWNRNFFSEMPEHRHVRHLAHLRLCYWRKQTALLDWLGVYWQQRLFEDIMNDITKLHQFATLCIVSASIRGFNKMWMHSLTGIKDGGRPEEVPEY